MPRTPIRLSVFCCWTIFPLLALLAVSCGSLDPRADAPRFHEGAAASLVLLYNSDQSIFVTKPDTRENGFLPLMSREDVVRNLDRPELGRDLAVVVVGYLRTPEQDEEIMHDWQAVLGGHGFRRVVFLRSGFNDDIDGLPVIRDSNNADPNLYAR
jgi:hypothetical protein